MNKTGNTLRETQEVLVNLLGFDYDVFKTTSCFEQNNSDAFSQLNPTEAKQLIMKLLQLEEYSSYEQLAREKANLFESELQVASITRNTLATESQKQVVDLDKIQKEMSINKLKIETLEAKRTLIKTTIEIEQKLKELKQSKLKFDSMDKCPTCLQKVQPEHKSQIASKYDLKISELENSLPKDIKTTELREVDETISNLKQANLEGKFLVESQIKKSQTDANNLEEVDKKIFNLKEEIAIYKKLATAFGRNGIPAFIIENSIPEIESNANELLDELEINMQLKLELQKELKGGGTSETLDIQVCRDKWQMSYFNFSGGERFLIDLVLRISLSVLLLRRKGCNNSTLIIDEGFGNLDSENRMKALKLVSIVKEKYNFQKIIIISHISEIQDSIGNKIKIVKRGTESFVEL